MEQRDVETKILEYYGFDKDALDFATKLYTLGEQDSNITNVSFHASMKYSGLGFDVQVENSFRSVGEFQKYLDSNKIPYQEGTVKYSDKEATLRAEGHRARFFNMDEALEGYR